VGTTINEAIEIARKGTKIVVVGVFGQDPPTKIGLVQDHEIDMRGSLMYVNEDYPRTLELVSSGRIQTDPLVSARYPLEKIADGFKHVRERRGETLKVLVDIP